MNSSLKARFERLGPVREPPRNRSGSGRAVLLSHEGLAGLRTISAALPLVRCGASMLQARRAVERLVAQGMTVAVVPMVEDEAALRKELKEAGVVALFPDRPQAVDVEGLRKRLGMSREVFAAACGLDQESMPNWERDRRAPGPVLAYLQAIEHAPRAVLAAYAGLRPEDETSFERADVE